MFTLYLDLVKQISYSTLISMKLALVINFKMPNNCWHLKIMTWTIVGILKLMTRTIVGILKFMARTIVGILKIITRTIDTVN